ncbi:MAG: replication initiation protein RepC [Alphaproteobacteria bacterium]
MLIQAQQYEAPVTGEQERYAVLPGNMQRGNVESILRELRSQIGMSAGRLMTLLAMMDQTRPQDWVRGDVEPVCYKQQTQLALLLGKTERQIRRDEEAFLKLGLVEKRVAANGGRSRSGGLGIVFTPLIDLIPRLKAIRDIHRTEAKQKEALVRRRSHLKGRAYSIISEVQVLGSGNDKATQQALEEISTWPGPENLRKQSLEIVSGHCETAQTLVDKLLLLLSSCKKMSGQRDLNVRSYIQDTTQEESLYCNASDEVKKTCTGLQPDIQLRNDVPKGTSKECLENKPVWDRELCKQKFSGALTPLRLYDLCDHDMKLYVHASLKTRKTPTHHDFIIAAYDCATHMGVNHSAWVKAIEAMGELNAALCIILIAANRDHPVRPVFSPGGTLVAMTRKHYAGQLNIIGGLIGLEERQRQAQAEQDCQGEAQ